MLFFQNIKIFGGCFSDIIANTNSTGDLQISNPYYSGGFVENYIETTNNRINNTIVGGANPQTEIENKPIDKNLQENSTKIENLSDIEIQTIIKNYYQLCAIVSTKNIDLPLINELTVEPTDVLFTKREVHLYLLRDKSGWRINNRIIGGRKKKTAYHYYFIINCYYIL